MTRKVNAKNIKNIKNKKYNLYDSLGKLISTDTLAEIKKSFLLAINMCIYERLKNDDQSVNEWIRILYLANKLDIKNNKKHRNAFNQLVQIAGFKLVPTDKLYSSFVVKLPNSLNESEIRDLIQSTSCEIEGMIQDKSNLLFHCPTLRTIQEVWYN